MGTKLPRCSRKCERIARHEGLCPSHALTKADDLFSLYVRERDGYICQYCGKTREQATMTCAHVVRRNYYGVRWVASNAVCLCWGCHTHFTHYDIDWRDWVEAHWPGRMRTLEMFARRYVRLGAHADYGNIIRHYTQARTELRRAQHGTLGGVRSMPGGGEP